MPAAPVLHNNPAYIAPQKMRLEENPAYVSTHKPLRLQRGVYIMIHINNYKLSSKQATEFLDQMGNELELT